MVWGWPGLGQFEAQYGMSESQDRVQTKAGWAKQPQVHIMAMARGEPGWARLLYLQLRAQTGGEQAVTDSWQRLRLGTCHVRLGHIPHCHVQDLELEAGVVGEFQGLACWAAASTGECERRD